MNDHDDVTSGDSVEAQYGEVILPPGQTAPEPGEQVGGFDPDDLPDPLSSDVEPVYAGELPDAAAEPSRAIMPAGDAAKMDSVNDYIQFGANFAVFDRETPFDHWRDFFTNLMGRLEFADRALPWIIGDALNFALHHYPDEAYSQFLHETPYSYGTLRNMAWVAGRWAPADRDQSVPWTNYRAASGLRGDAPRLAAAIVKNAALTGGTRREVLDQANQASRQVRADRKIAPAGQLDEPKIETQVHRPGCPTCECVGPVKLGKPAKLSPAERKRVAAAKNGTVDAPAKKGRGRPAALIAEPTARNGRGKAVQAAPKPIGTRRGKRGRSLEPNPSPVQVVGAVELSNDADPLDSEVNIDVDGGTLTAGFDHAEPELAELPF